jgi:hypothetical protein
MFAVPYRHLSPLSLTLFVMACGTGPEIEKTGTEGLASSDVERFVAGDQAGAAPLVVRIRALNEFGAAVASDPVTVDLDGSGAPLTFDAHGLATLSLTTPGRHTLITPDGTVSHFDVYDGSWGGLGLDRAWPGIGAAQHTARLSDGYLVSTSTELVWLSDDGLQEPVLTLPVTAAFTGIRVGRLDADDRLDAVAWNANSLFFLRGLTTGGLAWAGGIRIANGNLGGVSVEDINDDGLLDLGLGMVVDGLPRVEVLLADGLFGYELNRSISLEFPPESISLGTDSTTGLHRLVSVGDNTWEWLQEAAEGHYTVFSTEPPFQVPTDARLIDGGDFTGDRVDDAWLVAPRIQGQERKLFIIDLEADPITYVVRAPMAAYAMVTDFAGDGDDDLWTLDAENTLRVLVGGNGSQEERSLGALAAYGPVALADVVNDTALDLFLAGEETLYQYSGTLSDSDNWRARGQGLDNLLADVHFLHATNDLDADPLTADWAGVQIREGIVWAKAWSRAPDATTVIEQGRAHITDTADDLLDASWCADDLWVLLRDRLVRIDLGDELSEAASTAVVGARVACWSDGAGVLRAGEVDLFDLDGQLTQTLPAPNAQDLALGDGDLEPVLGTCDTTNCDVAAWGGPDGLRFVRTNATSATLDDGTSLDARGTPTIVDVDEDGLDDLLTVGEDGMITVIRATPDGPGQPRMFFIRRGLSGPATLVDGDNDGTLDLLALDDEGKLFLTPSFAP